MSNETKWTPGPWGWDDTVWDYDSSEQAPWLIQSATGEPVLAGEIKCKSEFDAHLIAAAPELYDELADRYTQTKCGCDHGACRRCRNDRETERVLAKARGEIE